MSLNLYSPGDLVLMLYEQPQVDVESRKLFKYHGPFPILQESYEFYTELNKWKGNSENSSSWQKLSNIKEVNTGMDKDCCEEILEVFRSLLKFYIKD